MGKPVWVKICGVTLPEDVEMVASAGADAIGLNFIPRSKRRVDITLARKLATAARGKLECVAVVADLTEEQVRELVSAVGVDRVQLHGGESNAMVANLGTLVYKAVGVGSAQDVEAAARVPGPRVLVDAKVGDLVGGTGTTFDWELVTQLCQERDVIVAGGLDVSNVATAVRSLRPFGVDVASGVERSATPGIKDESKVVAFLEEVRRAEMAWRQR